MEGILLFFLDNMSPLSPLVPSSQHFPKGNLPVRHSGIAHPCLITLKSVQGMFIYVTEKNYKCLQISATPTISSWCCTSILKPH